VKCRRSEAIGYTRWWRSEPRGQNPGFHFFAGQGGPVSSRARPWRPLAPPSSSAALCCQTSRSTRQPSRQPD
jgi:hypothetical protein